MRSCTLVLLCALASGALAAQRVPRLTNVPGLEAEAFIPAATATQGAVTRQNMTPFGAGWSGGSQLMWQAPGAGAALQLALPSAMIGAGPRRVIVGFTRAPDYGRFTLSIGNAAPVTLDGYAPAVMRDSALIGTAQVGAEPLVVRVQVVGKAPQSHGFFVGLDRFSFQSEGAPPTAALRSVTPAEPSTSTTGQGIQNIANGRARNQNPMMVPALTQTIANVPVVRVGAPSKEQANTQRLLGGLIGAPLAPLSSEVKLTIARNALGGLSNGSQSLMSLGGLQVDEEGTIRFTAAEPRLAEGYALGVWTATTDPQGPYFIFWLGDGLHSHLKPGFWVYYDPKLAKLHLLDCKVDVGEASVFDLTVTAGAGNIVMSGQELTFSYGTHHYTVLVEDQPPAWSEVYVHVRPAPQQPPSNSPLVMLEWCEVTPIK